MHIWFMEDSILSQKRAMQNGFAVAVLISGVSAPVAFFFFFCTRGKPLRLSFQSMCFTFPRIIVCIMKTMMRNCAQGEVAAVSGGREPLIGGLDCR